MDATDLSEFFTTKSQATDFSTRLATLTEKIYENNFNMENTLQELFGIKKKDLFVTLLRDNNIDTNAASQLKEFLNKLQQHISSLPVLSITIAFEPQEATLRSMSEWFVLNNKNQVVFDFVVDPKIIAGATIDYRGKHLDYSIKPVFQQILQKTLTPNPQPTNEYSTHQDKQKHNENVSV